EPQRDNQELHHAVFLNAGLQIHDPSVGFPGFRTGHIYAQMLTPRLHDQPPVKFDVPGVRRQEVARYLKKNQNELRQRATITRLTGTQNKSTNDERSMPKVISTDTSLQAIGVPVPFTFKAPFPTSPAALFLTHPIHQPPPCDTTDMHAVGLTADRKNVVLHVSTERNGERTLDPRRRPGTPCLPWELHTSLPPLAPSIPPFVKLLLEAQRPRTTKEADVRPNNLTMDVRMSPGQDVQIHRLPPISELIQKLADDEHRLTPIDHLLQDTSGLLDPSVMATEEKEVVPPPDQSMDQRTDLRPDHGAVKPLFTCDPLPSTFSEPTDDSASSLEHGFGERSSPSQKEISRK
ncbi:hypothetical protein B0H14DRAFT_2575335, partial [Mycena olivaceomarginata]